MVSSRIFRHIQANKNKFISYVFLFIFLFVSFQSAAQKKITGKVMDSNTGVPLPGVTVGIKGSTSGTISNDMGQFSIQAKSTDSLVFSFVGYLPKTLQVGNKTKLDVELQSTNQQLDQLVVVGYGTQQAKDVTGSVGTVKMESIRNQPITSATDALAGQVSGVVISPSNGIPGGGPKIQIRGIGAIGAGSEPLYVVDGFPLPESDQSGSQVSNPLTSIPPADIQSITVLKDASATAIYGSRGANGVVIITTKKGSSGKLQFHFDAYTAWQQVPDFQKPNIMNAEQFATFMKERIEDENRLTGQNDTIPKVYENPSALGKGTNWYDAITRIAPMQNYNFSMSGGNDNISTYTSVGYLHQDGVVIGTNFDRYSLRTNINAHLSPKLSVGLNFAPTYSKGNRVIQGGEGRYENGFGSAIVASPIPAVYKADGSYNEMIQSPGTFNYPNPVMVLKETTNKQEQLRLIGSGYLQYEILKGLIFKSTINVDWENNTSDYFRPSILGTLNSPPPSNAGGSHNNYRYLNWANENSLTYKKMFRGGHSLTVLIDLSEQKQIDNAANFSGSQFPGDEIRTLNTAAKITGGTSIDSWALASYLGRLNYSYKDKYLLTATLRRDGSSRFGQNKRWGTFPSVALGWRISNENWLQNTTWLNDLRLRASYGITGNDQIGNFTYEGIVDINNYVVGGSNLAHGATVNTLSNPNLAWERTEEINLGLNLSVLNNRLSFEGDFYRRRTNSLLLNLEVPQSSGFSNSIQNIGEVQNTGAELSLNAVNIDHHNFNWTTNFNISFNRNKTLALGPNNEPIKSGTSGEGHYTNITVVGKPVGMFYGYKVLGLYQSEDDVQKSPNFPGAIPGNMKVADINGDGTITPISDFTIIGNPYPKFTYGMTNTVSYKDLTLRILLQGSEGADKMKASYEYLHNIDGVFNVLTDVIDRWHSTDNPGSGKAPTTAGPSFARVMYRDVSSWWIYKASYLWFKNIMLSWTLPHDLIKGINNAQLYLSVQNAFVVTSYPGNPAVTHYGDVHGDSGGALTPGIDFSSYPVPRILTVGVKLDF